MFRYYCSTCEDSGSILSDSSMGRSYEPCPDCGVGGGGNKRLLDTRMTEQERREWLQERKRIESTPEYKEKQRKHLRALGYL